MPNDSIRLTFIYSYEGMESDSDLPNLEQMVSREFNAFATHNKLAAPTRSETPSDDPSLDGIAAIELLTGGLELITNYLTLRTFILLIKDYFEQYAKRKKDSDPSKSPVIQIKIDKLEINIEQLPPDLDLQLKKIVNKSKQK